MCVYRNITKCVYQKGANLLETKSNVVLHSGCSVEENMCEKKVQSAFMIVITSEGRVINLNADTLCCPLKF